MNDTVKIPKFFEPIMKDGTAKSYQEYFKYFIPFHKYFIKKIDNRNDFIQNLNITAWINSVYPYDYILIHKDKNVSKIRITSIEAGEYIEHDEDINQESSNYVVLYQKDFHNRIESRSSFIFIVDTPIPPTIQLNVYDKNRQLNFFSSEHKVHPYEVPLPQFSLEVIVKKDDKEEFIKREMDLSVVCFHKREQKLTDEQIDRICSADNFDNKINDLFYSLKRMRKNKDFDKEIQRLINDSDKDVEFCLLKNNLKLSKLRIEYRNIREINLYIGLLNLYKKVWRTIAGFVDISLTYKYSFGYYLKKGMKYIPFRDREVIIQTLLSSNQSHTQAKDITLNPEIAKTNRNNQISNPYQSRSMFIQLYHELLKEPISLYQNNKNCFRVRYDNQLGIDDGGIFRDLLTVITDEIFHSNMKLMKSCKEDLYIPNTDFSKPQYSELYRQIGRIMGISIRTELKLIFPLPQFIWKLIYDPNLDLNEKDIKLYDKPAIQKCQEIQERLNDKVRDEVNQKFNIKTDLGVEPEISDKTKNNFFFTITKDINMIESFCDLRKRQFLSQIGSIRKGILDVIPVAVLSTISYTELEFLICGKPEINVEILKKNTGYEGYEESEKVIQNYWEIFENDFTDTEKSKWIYFVTGSYRLPSEKKWNNKFKIRKYVGRTDMLPLVHTCFFTVDLPAYDSYEKLKEKMLKAIEFGIFGMYNY